ncbi:MAG: hypothetical protein H6Q17_391 [Bacteroidetes bacterium]|jgi:hypothetical protein|nr:hypothetical protein [Bacteroidota bacterium]
MKTIKFIGILAILCGVISCEKDEQRSLENYWVSFATVTQTNNDGSFSVRLDNGTSALATKVKPSGFTTAKGERLIINYSLLSDSTDSQTRIIQINSIGTVEIKKIGILNTTNKDSIGNDPVDVEKIWSGGNYLNVSFSYYGNKQEHLFSLVKNTTIAPANDGTIHLELRQNAYGDALLVKNRAIISFDLRALTSNINASNIQMVIEAKNYTGNVMNYALTYQIN